MNTAQPAITITGLTKRYGDLTAVDHLSLNVQQGECFSLLGVNGAGKTTTIKMLCGLTRPDEGDALLCGHSIRSDIKGVHEVIGVSPQETAVAPNLSVAENLALMGGVHGFTRAQQKEKTMRLAEQFGLTSVLCKKAGKLSGGFQRRLSIAMALIGDPEILFLDEPTLGLDVLARSDLWEVIRSLTGRVTVVLTTHYMEEAESLADRVAVMKDGHLLALDTPKALIEQTETTRLEEAFLCIVKGVTK